MPPSAEQEATVKAVKVRQLEDQYARAVADSDTAGAEEAWEQLQAARQA